MSVRRNQITKLVYAAVCLGLCFLLSHLSVVPWWVYPMHIPVLLCGFLCGGLYGVVIGAAAPLLSSFLFGMPPLYPTGVAMVFELAAYGCIAGILFKLLIKRIGKTSGLKIVTVYITLIISMLCGRVVWGIAQLLMTTFTQDAFTFAAFIAGAFTGAVPAIITHIIAIPIIVVALMQAKLINFDHE